MTLNMVCVLVSQNAYVYIINIYESQFVCTIPVRACT